MFKTFIVVLLIGLLAWAFQTTRPPPPSLCGSPNGPPITAPRIKLKDGRYLAYQEHGVSKDLAKYEVIFFHGFGSGRHDGSILTPEIAEELGIHLVTFDRPGYGESDPDPKRTMKSLSLDIEELADQLGLGSKFYVIGYSMGGQSVWACLKYISHRLAGATLIAPVVNYWWPGFPANLSKEAYYQQFPQDQWALRVAHYTPWLTYWWNTQKLFPASSVIAGKAKFSHQDVQLLNKMLAVHGMKERPNVKQQGEFESIHRDMMIGFGTWEFDPMELDAPFLDNKGSVHLWQGDDDGLVPVTLQRYIAGKLPWIHYHEVADGGHLFPYADGMREAIFKTLLLGEK
ncbi:2,6-dioxo-6-phenylhexa-3-enoate hydrolase [Bertholletia excelsa]